MSLEQDLQQEQVDRLDLSDFVTVEIGTSVGTTVKKMREAHHNCAIILDQGKLVGIFTDRDILQKIADQPETWSLPIDDFMTPSPLTVPASAPASEALALMDEHRFRNVPVVNQETGEVIGNLTHYAIIKYLADRFPESVYNQAPQPNRVPRKRDGA
ncbi:MAG: CBS domain-containing protein [Chloroflexi bacterium]|nr:MAG: CBS domain-containing protein [Chloroflexota bacterium]